VAKLVIPAQAGIQKRLQHIENLDFRLRGNDGIVSFCEFRHGLLRSDGGTPSRPGLALILR
jgi:hypothetical protein